jgi:hypothetical protein
MKLSDPIPAWPASTLAQRLEDARVLLSVHRFLRESENKRIKAAIVLPCPGLALRFPTAYRR